MPVRVVVVRNGSRAPVAGADVLLTPTTDWSAPAPSGRPATSAHAGTDGDGVARFLLPPGDYVATVREDEHDTTFRIAVRTREQIVIAIDTPAAGGRAPLFVRVRQGGLPVAGTIVRVVGGPAKGLAGVTDEKGSCVLYLRPGAHRLACVGEETDILHEGAGSLVFALAGIPDEAWEPVERDDHPFFVAESRAHLELPPVGEKYEHVATETTATARVLVV